MVPAREVVAVGPGAALVAVRQKVSDYLQLVKVRLTLLVLATGLVSFWLGSGPAPVLARLSWFGLGTLLVIAGANAFNQIAEREQDALMTRTARRPLPAGRMGVREAGAAAAAMSIAGLMVLALQAGLLTAVLGGLAWAIYVFAYTPLKRRSEWSTPVGALAGAIPPLMGWAAVRSEISYPALLLFATVFFWQFPHTWAIASLYAEDYLRAGYRVLPLADGSGSRLKLQMAICCSGLSIASLLPAALGFASPVYGAGAVAANALLVVCAAPFALTRSRRPAGHLLAASLAYLPVILALMAWDRRGY
jgi:protoheme IX farnesyltransferase